MKFIKQNFLRILFFAFVVFCISPIGIFGQGSALIRSCSGIGLITKQAKLEVTKDGDVNITPCDNRAVLLRGLVLNGSGTVQSVGLSLPSIFSVSSSPITSAGVLNATFNSQSANTIFAAPSGASGTPIFRGLTALDIPSLDATKITTGVFSTARLGTGTADSSTVLSGSGQWVNSTPFIPVTTLNANYTLTAADHGKTFRVCFGSPTLSAGLPDGFTVTFITSQGCGQRTLTTFNGLVAFINGVNYAADADSTINLLGSVTFVVQGSVGWYATSTNGAVTWVQ